MGIDGPETDSQFGSDLLARFSFRDAPQHLLFARREFDGHPFVAKRFEYAGDVPPELQGKLFAIPDKFNRDYSRDSDGRRLY